jgi:hypothetical protein
MRKLGVVLAAGVLLGASVASAEDEATLKAIGTGRAVYLANCASCHGADARGLAVGTNGGTPDLTLVAARDGEFSPLHVVGHVRGRQNGASNPDPHGMPRWNARFRHGWPGGAGAAQLQEWALVKYLAFVQQPSATGQAVASK